MAEKTSLSTQKTTKDVEVKEKISKVRILKINEEWIYDRKRNKTYKVEPISFKALIQVYADEENKNYNSGNIGSKYQNNYEITYTERKLLSDCFHLKITNWDLFCHILFRIPTIEKQVILPGMVASFDVMFVPGQTYHSGIFLWKSVTHVDYDAKDPFIPLILAVSCIQIPDTSTTDPDDKSDFSLLIWVMGLVNNVAPVNYSMQLKSIAPLYENWSRTLIKNTVCDIRAMKKISSDKIGRAVLLTPLEVQNLTNNGKFPLQVYIKFDKGPSIPNMSM